MRTKKGMASLYLVAFTTLLLGIVTMSFARVMITEKREASNSDLSQSAYDSALAGIEDAKTAIIMYEACLNGADFIGGKNCSDIKTLMTEGFNNGNCDVVQKILGKETDSGEVQVGEKSLNQAYTCVPVADDSPTYHSVLNEDNRSRVIPAKISNDQHADVVGIELQWYTPGVDSDASDTVKYMFPEADNKEFIQLGTKDAAMDSAPVLTFEIFQTDEEFTMAQLDVNNEKNTGTDHAMIMLYPDASKNGNVDKIDVPNRGTVTPGTFVSASDLLNASNKSNQAARDASSKKDSSIVPKMVTCGYGDDGGARCRATIEFPATYNNESDNETYAASAANGIKRASQTFMFRVSLPYGAPQTDFSIQPCTKIESGHCSETVGFTGAQYIIDSTGRASTLYRRIIARVETAPKFIFPEYAVQVYGDNSTIEKDFWVTQNCWLTDGKGNSAKCANNGDAS